VTAAVRRPWGRSLFFIVLFTLAVVVGRESRPDASQVALVWPAAGVGVWWLMDLRGRRLGIDAGLLFVVTVLPQLLTGLPPAAALLFGVANLGHALAGTWMVRRLWPAGAALDSPNDVRRLLLVALAAAAVSAPISALLGWALLEADLGRSFVLFAVRNAGTTFVVVSLVLALRAPHHPRSLLRRRRAVEFGLMLVVSAAVFQAVVVLDGELPLGFVVIALPVWAGARLDVPRAALVSGTVGILTVVVTVAGYGVLADVGSLTQLAVLVQVFMVLSVLVGVMLAAMQHARDEVAEQLRASEARLREASESALVATAVVALADPDRVLDGANPAMRELFPGAGDPLRWRDLLSSESLPVVEEALASMLDGTAPSWHGEVRHELPSGGTLWTQVHVSSLSRRRGPSAAAVVQMLDVTARKDAEAHLSHLALHDPLTGLPNRLLLRDRIDHALAMSARARSSGAVVFRDLDGFKTINDSLGHDVGDAVLCATAERLRSVLRPGDTVGRMGGDEFVACCGDITSPEQARGLARRLVQALEPPIAVGEHLLSIGISAGVALSGARDDATSLLRAADTAMYAAKRAGRGRVATSWEDPPTPVRTAVRHSPLPH
jgi:diguanylate cyclase (GGDEF)-like protein/PAS domain S-box-containing protein